jgi:integrase
MRKTLTDKGVAALKPRPKRYAYADPQMLGHYVRVQPSGQKSYVAVARDPASKQIWATIGPADVLSIQEARDRAREAIKRIRAGLPAIEAPDRPETFADVAEQWLQRHVRAKGLRSEKEVTRLLNAHILPAWKDQPFRGIGRSDVTALLDEVEDDHGARQADYVLAITRGIMNWFAARNDHYVPPIVKGMRRTNPSARARARILDDSEIQVLWRAAESNGAFGAAVRLLLLTGQRRNKVFSMKWADISIDGTWTIATAEREKGNPGVLELPPVALDIIRNQPRVGNNPYVFPAARGDGHMRGYSKFKRAFDAKMPPEMPQYGLHDLRRSCRSLLARGAVRPDIAEALLGHKLQGVQATYNRYGHTPEKADALHRLATLIDGIVNPNSRENVLPMTKRGKRR